MEPAVECTHCGVVMTSWSVPASPIRYFQCPFCQRTHSSHYGEVFRSRAGARFLGSAPRSTSPSEIPMARPEDVRWATIKSAANRWYARLEADEHRNASSPRPARSARLPIPLTVTSAEPPAAAPAPIQLVVAVGAGKRR